jgi:hypothetical protein
MLEWETGATGFWDTAVAGSSALQAALQRELRHEIASELGVCTGGVYWDMAKFCDALKPDVIMESGPWPWHIHSAPWSSG